MGPSPGSPKHLPPPPHKRVVEVHKKQNFNDYDAYESYGHDDYTNEYANGGYSDDFDEEEHWRRQQQNDVYDSVPLSNVRGVARVQVSAVEPMVQSPPQNIPQAPPLPRSDSSYNQGTIDRQLKYSSARKEERRESVELKHEPKREHKVNEKIDRHNEVHIRYDPHASAMHSHKHSFIDGFNSSPQDEKPPKKKEPSQTAGAIRAIINNLKGNSEKHDDVPRVKVSTNPFLRGDGHLDRMTPSRKTPDNGLKNVQEVVQKMNNGDWPINIEDEDDRVSADLARDRDREIRRMPKMDKARQWETLHRKKEERRERILPPTELEKRNESRSGSRRESIEGKGKDGRRSQVEVVHCGEPPDIDKLSEKSEEHTSVSTDSALYTESAVCPLPVYKSLPTYHTSINVVVPDLPGSRPHKQHEQIGPKITVNGGPVSHNNLKSPLSREEVRSPHRSAQSAVLKEELKTDDIQGYEVTKIEVENKASPRNASKEKGGRFVKKSAAALIAKKQGISASNDESPNSADFIDPRIAAEIRSLKEREEELKKSRTELGLPTIDDVIDTWKGRRPTGIRSAQSLDHLNRLGGQSSPLERSHSSYNVYVERPKMWNNDLTTATTVMLIGTLRHPPIMDPSQEALDRIRGMKLHIIAVPKKVSLCGNSPQKLFCKIENFFVNRPTLRRHAPIFRNPTILRSIRVPVKRSTAVRVWASSRSFLRPGRMKQDPTAAPARRPPAVSSRLAYRRSTSRLTRQKSTRLYRGSSVVRFSDLVTSIF
ncbi:unnamed protein product [Caenorhabditis auriculariae]|uniref:Uncharacterized protein n=1 Tax=Caenorhabditis auriculariae TaxID=2777116 RepID=A0A8S1HNF4_9PELO|nr:unnamed protein product [Caenorhabditis auriculariae]